MALLAWPSGFDFDGWTIEMMTRDIVYTSQRTGTEITQRGMGERWQATIDLESLDPPQWMEWQGLLAALRGTTNALAVPDPAYPGMRGLAGGTVTASGNADSNVLTLGGITGSNPAIRRGDRFNIAGRLYMATADANQTSGAATVYIFPRLRGAASNAAVTFTGLTCPMRLVNGEQTKATFRPPNLASFRDMKFIEPLP